MIGPCLEVDFCLNGCCQRAGRPWRQSSITQLINTCKCRSKGLACCLINWELPSKAAPGPLAPGCCFESAGPWLPASPQSWLTPTSLRKGYRNPLGPYDNSFARLHSTHHSLHPFAATSAERLLFQAQWPALSARPRPGCF